MEEGKENETGELQVMESRGPHPLEFLVVVAVLAGLFGWGFPRLLSLFAYARVSAMVDFVSEARAGVLRYQNDVGAPLALDASGTYAPQALREADGAWSFGWVLTRSVPASPKGLWDRFQGPYLRATRLESPPMGSTLRLGAGWVGLGTRQVPPPPVFDLAGVGSSTIPAGKAVAWMTVSDVERSDFEALDARLDGAMGGTFDKRCRQGEVQWSPEGGGTLRIHLAHQ